MRNALQGLLVAAAFALEGAALYFALAPDRVGALACALALHAAAVLFCRWAARRRRPDLSQVENDLVVAVAAVIPLFGPALAWSLPAPRAEEKAETSHEMFLRYEEHVRPCLPDYERTVFTGDYDKDLARELDAESYHEVLRHGNTDQKRNALHSLAEMGEPRHIELIRRCLLEPDHEVRLYAYSELERLGRVHEEEIGKRTRQLEKDPRSVEALRALADANFAYAESGIHDEEMADFYFRAAARYAAKARECGDTGPEPLILEARARARLKEFEASEECLRRLDSLRGDVSHGALVRAEIAFRRRDFAAARHEAEAVVSAGGELPDWLAALTGGPGAAGGEAQE